MKLEVDMNNLHRWEQKIEEDCRRISQRTEWDAMDSAKATRIKNTVTTMTLIFSNIPMNDIKRSEIESIMSHLTEVTQTAESHIESL